MNSSLQHSKIIALLVILSAIAAALGQTIGGTQQDESLPQRPRQPTGYLGPLGRYHTIEGVWDGGRAKLGANTLVVDVVDGKPLDKRVFIPVINTTIPRKERCVLKGYESGHMVGRPPAEYALTRELGGDVEELQRRDATGWHWSPYFVPLMAVQPKDLEIKTKWGLPKK